MAFPCGLKGLAMFSSHGTLFVGIILDEVGIIPESGLKGGGRFDPGRSTPAGWCLYPIPPVVCGDGLTSAKLQIGVGLTKHGRYTDV
jgi:hypothetical protein